MESSSPSQASQASKRGEEGNSKSSNTRFEYKEIISTLPRENGWLTSLLELHQYEGFWTYPVLLEGVISVQRNFVAQPDDIFLCSNPKSGTTWLKALAFAITTRTTLDDSANPLHTTVPHECVPFLEIDLADKKKREQELPLLSTHIPYTSLPKSILSSGCKIVYIWRDPKDAFVSLWHFIVNVAMSKGDEPISIQDALELFCKGVSYYGPYWDHVLGYWKAATERPEEILFLKYEEVKKDTAFYVNKLAEFMGYPFSSEEIEKGVVQKIVKMCSFEHLSNLEVNKTGIHRRETEIWIPNDSYFRKGKVGDWQNTLTPQMAAVLDSITEQKFGDIGLTVTSGKPLK